MVSTGQSLFPMQRLMANTRYMEMSEGRRTQVILLDDRRLDILVQPRLFVSELLNIVASHCHLKDPDKQYFGLTFYDEKQQCNWLQDDRRVLDHEYPRKFVVSGATLILRHQVKFYAESITQLAHPASVELLFLQTRMQLSKGLIQPDQTAFLQLTSFALQACFGEFTNVNTTKMHLKRLALLPSTKSCDLMGSEAWEDRVCEMYENLSGMSKGTALVSYMSCLERLHTYGVHIYKVKDKSGTTLVLGISSRGIYQYEPENTDKPRKGFHWKQLENLYYRDRKFSIEVHDPKRSVNSFNIYDDLVQDVEEELDDLAEAICDPSTHLSMSRRAFTPSGVYVHVFWCETAQLCKTIWSLAISQHQFYLDRRSAAKQRGTQFVFHTPRELAMKLDQGMTVVANTGSLFSHIVRNGSTDGPGGSSDLGSSVSSQSVHSIPSTCSAERSEEEKQRELEKCKKLKEQKRELEDILIQKLKDLKEVCIKEGEITGQLPAETRLTLIPGEAEPKIKRRVGTAFAITSETMNKHTKADQIAKLEADVEIHKKIVAAALKLASDSNSNKSVRKKRRRDFESARQRLRELEQRLHQLRLSSSKPDLPNAHFEGVVYGCAETEPGNFRICKSLPNTPSSSVPDLTDDQRGPNNWRMGNKFRLPSRLRETNQAQNGLHHSTSFPAGAIGRSSGGTGNGGWNRGASAVVRGDTRYTSSGIPNGNRSQSMYQSNRSGTVCQSNHSLESMSSASSSGAPVSSEYYTVDIAPSSDQSVGAYNIPNQRTSWDHDWSKQTNSDCAATSVAGSSESLNIGLIQNRELSRRRPVPMPNDGDQSANCYTASLDRRVLKQMQRDRWRDGVKKPEGLVVMRMPPASPTVIKNLERSPTRYRPPPTCQARNLVSSTQHTTASAISPRLVHKLLGPQKNDVGTKYNQNSNSSRQCVQRSLSHSSTPSPQHRSRMSSIQEQGADDADDHWYGNGNEKGKTATIV